MVYVFRTNAWWPKGGFPLTLHQKLCLYIHIIFDEEYFPLDGLNSRQNRHYHWVFNSCSRAKSWIKLRFFSSRHRTHANQNLEFYLEDDNRSLLLESALLKTGANSQPIQEWCRKNFTLNQRTAYGASMKYWFYPTARRIARKHHLIRRRRRRTSHASHASWEIPINTFYRLATPLNFWQVNWVISGQNNKCYNEDLCPINPHFTFG